MTCKATISKFKVSAGHRGDGLEYWVLFDLLGLFLLTVGEAPIGATKRNFYLHLTAMYGLWCSAIGDSNLVKYVPMYMASDGEPS
jgi:hypothetical protein